MESTSSPTQQSGKARTLALYGLSILILAAPVLVSIAGQIRSNFKDHSSRPPREAFETSTTNLQQHSWWSNTGRDSDTPMYIGVVGAWPEDNAPSNTKETPRLQLSERICVRFRDLDGWLLRLLAYERIDGQEALTLEEKDKEPYLLVNYAKSVLKLPLKTGGKGVPVSLETDDARKEKNDRAQKRFSTLFFHCRERMYPIINGLHLTGYHPINAQDSGVYWPASAQGPSPDPDRSDDLVFEINPDDSPEVDRTNFEKLTRSIGISKKVHITLGIPVPGGDPLVSPSIVRPDGATPAQQPKLVLVPGWKVAWVIATFGLIFSLMIYLSLKTNILRSCNMRRRPDGRCQLSLSHFQLAFWFVIILASFLYLWLMIGAVPVLSDTALYLTGIALATATGSAAISSIKNTDSQLEAYNASMANRSGMPAAKLLELVKGFATAATEKWQLAIKESKPPEEIEPLLQDHLEYQRQLEYLRHAKFQRCLVDLLSENGEITLHRFQMMAWTLGLGLVFVTSVLGKLAMPDFSATLLALMGLSAGAYLGFRIPEAGTVVKTLTSRNALDEEAPKVTEARTTNPNEPHEKSPNP